MEFDVVFFPYVKIDNNKILHIFIRFFAPYNIKYGKKMCIRILYLSSQKIYNKFKFIFYELVFLILSHHHLH